MIAEMAVVTGLTPDQVRGISVADFLVMCDVVAQRKG